MKKRIGQICGKAEVQKWLPQLFMWGMIMGCTAVLLTMCFDRGIDFDEAYSYRTAHDNALTGITREIIDAHDTDIPLYYWALRIWTRVCGESWFAYRLFSVAGTVASMLLGATFIRRTWGYLTAYLFILPMGLAPSLIHVGVNIRMYSWTVFFVTACGLLVYSLAQKPEQKEKWFLLFAVTLAALFCHYFTAFCHLFLYLYLLVSLLRTQRKHIWKVFVCGGGALLPFGIWLIISDFFHLKDSRGGGLTLERIQIKEMLEYCFHTEIKYSTVIGICIFAVAFFAVIFLRKNFKKADRSFALLSLTLFPVTYFLAAFLASMANHFFITRHIMHGMGLMWLGFAIVIPRINLRAYVSALMFVMVMGGASYHEEFWYSYGNIPYLAATESYISENMQQGDIVIYNAEPKFDLLYGCYMPEQVFYHVSEITDISELEGKRVWFFLCTQEWFPPEVTEQYDISYDFMGHYGFQIINNCTDFDLLWMKIEEVAE